MSAFLRLALLAATASLLPATAHALDDFTRASSNFPTDIALCGETTGAGTQISIETCKQAGYDKLVAAVDKSFAAALAKAPANIRPLFKRDEVWFNEMILEAADTVQQADDAGLRENFAEVLRQRATTLDDLARGFARSGLAGSWANAFGRMTLTATGTGVYRLDGEVSSNYGGDKRWHCKLGATVKPDADGWLFGEADVARSVLDAGAPAGKKPAAPRSIKLRRQGGTLRIVLVTTEEQWFSSKDPECDRLGQITGTYFASGEADAADKADTSFVAPSFDCTRPGTATDEEICADPELAANDRLLNSAWRTLLPRLDDATRRALIEDQRLWVNSQTLQYPEFLHPAWEKRTSQMHYTVSGRNSLQRERIALLDGFDDKRTGLAGTWLAYNVVIKVTVNEDGSVQARGWKWSQGDWKAGCDYGMNGTLMRGKFRSSEARKNPDTLERDHAMLVVNRLDDVFAKKREGTDDNDGDEPKCKRNTTISSTARLFPAKPSQDIDNLPSAIR